MAVGVVRLAVTGAVAACVLTAGAATIVERTSGHHRTIPPSTPLLPSPRPVVGSGPDILAVVDGHPGIYSAAGTLLHAVAAGNPLAVATDPRGGWVLATAGGVPTSCTAAVTLLQHVGPDGRLTPVGPRRPLQGYARSLAVTPDGATVAAALTGGCPAAASITVTPLAGGGSMRRWSLPGRQGNAVVGLSWAADGIRLSYTAGEDTGAGLGGSASVLDTSSPEVTLSASPGSRPAPSCDPLRTAFRGLTSDELVLAECAPEVSDVLFAVASGTTQAGVRLARIPAYGSLPQQLSVTGDGTEVLVATSAGLWIVERGAAHRVPVASGPSMAAWDGDPTARTAAPLLTVPAPTPTRLAFVSAGRLMVQDGETGKASPVIIPAATAAPVAPAWSHDGAYLSVVVGTTVRVYRADRSLVDVVSGVTGRPAWSPTAELLAVPREGTDVALVRPGHRTGQLPVAAGPHSLAWSHDGTRLAVAAGDGRTSTIRTYPVAGGSGTVRVVREDAGLQVVSWWDDDRGLVYRLDPEASGSPATDGAQVFMLALGGSPERIAPGGAVLGSDGRTIWTGGRRVKLCGSDDASCSPIDGGPGVAATSRTLDPAIDPLGSLDPRLAFVVAAAPPDASTVDQASLERSYGTRRLAVWGYTGGNAGVIARAGTGVADPGWSPDGTHLRYVEDDAIWEIGADGSDPHRVAGPLFAGAWPYEHGQVDWGDQFAWSG